MKMPVTYVIVRFRSFTLLLLSLVLIYAFGGVLEPARAANSATSGKIVFSSTRDGNYEIYIMNADGSQQTNLTNNPEADDWPSWSPDGKKIIYSAWVGDNWELFVMEPDGSYKTRITYTAEDEYDPQWSPDGTRIAYSTNTLDIYVMNPDGNGVTQITTHPRADGSPTWSPDGTRLAFQSDRTQHNHIYVTSPGLIGAGMLTDSGTGTYQVPAWSPDGSTIVASRFYGVGDLALLSPNQGFLGVIPNTREGYFPAWASDGSAIAFHAEVNGYADIFSINVDGTNRTNLTNTPGAHDFRPAWQPVPANTDPVAEAGGPYLVEEGSSVLLDAELSSDAEDPETLSFAWDLDGDGDYESTGQAVSFSALSLDGPTTRLVSLQVTDPMGASSTDTAIIDIRNANPSANLALPGEPLSEGNVAVLTFDTVYDPGVDDSSAGFTYSFDCTNDGIIEVEDTTESSFGCVFSDDGHYMSLGTIRDKDGGTATYTIEIQVSNTAPTISPVAAPLDPQQVNSRIDVSATFFDPGTLDTHSAGWNWGDGQTSVGVITESSGSGSVIGYHSYLVPGIYTITLTVTDKDEGAGTSVFQFVVIYDPKAGFVTGGGWINSPPGAYGADPTLVGKASFGFVSKYQKGSSVPSGNTEFQFRAGGLSFKSIAYDWLVVAGAKAQFKGVGTVNDIGEYGFMLTAVDDGQAGGNGDIDRFRIKIWEKLTGVTIYDNQSGEADSAVPTTTLGGGSIVIHK